jgi:DNA-binding XRE family transcriptional regulator
MTLVADKSVRPALRQNEKDVLKRIRSMHPSRIQRFSRLVDLYRNAKTEEDAGEIEEVLAEMLFGEPNNYTASKLSTEESSEARASLEKHRKYVGVQIRKCRQKLKMSQEELAERAGLPQSHICRLETGKHAPTYLTIEKLAAALGTTTSQIDPGFDG